MSAYKIITCLSVFFLFNNAFAEADLETLRKNAEKNIQSCEQSYQNVKALKSRLDQIKKPGVFASKALKNAYTHRDIYKKTFESRFAEFTQFTNDKIKIRTAPDFTKLQDEIAAHTSNCGRFSSGLFGFIDWATTGKAPSGFEKIYQNWVNEVSKESK